MASAGVTAGVMAAVDGDSTAAAVSATSITVTSEDGYSRTYVVGSATSVDNGADQISAVATGHTVRIVATGADSTATATTITDTNLASATQPGGGPGAPMDQQGGTPANQPST